MLQFQIHHTDSGTRARQGTLTTRHGAIETPFFMPVGTQATVKGISAGDLHEIGAQIMLSNTYHLYLRPGLEVIEPLGGLHAFMSWDKPVLTDSGGFQIFSLAKFRKITDEGIRFQSHHDGRRCFLSPEDVMRVEQQLGPDMIMPLDECAPYPCTYEESEESVARTTLWAGRSRKAFDDNGQGDTQALFGIIQGATFEDLRRRSAEEIMEVGFEGYAIGGVSVGEPVPLMFETVDWVAPLLPWDRPRYLMGIGLPDQIVKAVGEGIDMFDTCIPTRYGRHGSAFTSRGRRIILNAEFTSESAPVDEDCDCLVCRKYSSAYLRHLFKASEMLGLRLLSYHNLYFYLNLMRDIRAAVKENRYAVFRRDFLEKYGSELYQSGAD